MVTSPSLTVMIGFTDRTVPIAARAADFIRGREQLPPFHARFHFQDQVQHPAAPDMTANSLAMRDYASVIASRVD